MNNTSSTRTFPGNISLSFPSATSLIATQLLTATEAPGFKVTKFIVYILILLVSTAGNAAVIGVILSSKRMRSSAGNLLILTLALHDLLTPILSIPFDLVLEENEYIWSYGLILCKLLYPTTTLTTTCSSLILAAISLDRYRTILHPFKRKLSITQVKCIIVVIHLISALVVSPYAVFLGLQDGTFCVELWPNLLYRQMFTVLLFLTQYLLPLVFMITMYILAALNLFATTQSVRLITERSDMDNNSSATLGTRLVSRESFVIRQEQNIRVTKMFGVIVAVFAVCTLPNEVLWLWIDFGKKGEETSLNEVKMVCRFFTYTNSCLNPLIFCKFRREFRRGFINILRWMICAKPESDLDRVRRIWANKDAALPDKTTHLRVDENGNRKDSRAASISFDLEPRELPCLKPRVSDVVLPEEEEKLYKRPPRTGILKKTYALAVDNDLTTRRQSLEGGINNLKELKNEVISRDVDSKKQSDFQTKDALKGNTIVIDFEVLSQLKHFTETKC